MILYLFFLFISVNSLRIQYHPLESRIAYIYDIKNINKIDHFEMSLLTELFQKHPLLIFKNIDNISPNEFIDFVKYFDPDCDEEALLNPDKYPNQILQPFDQFPDCKHVAPRGNIELNNYYNINNIKIKPSKGFINNYLWHTDLLGHESKLPNVITSFYIVNQPLIGGDTDFISGETIYEHLTRDEQIACENILVEINKKKIINNQIMIDYAGVNRLEDYTESENIIIPIVFAPDNDKEKPRILIMPTFFEKVVGWNIRESRSWINYFMNNKVLPYRVSIQWKKGDLAIFNNRRFIHSSTPARNYLDNRDSNERLLLQTFIPTKRPLLGVKPLESNIYSCYNLKWINDKDKSILSTHNTIKYAVSMALKNNISSYNDKYYVLK